jgi:hypothetical protein
MSEWWTYNPAEMLMFSPQVYWRMVERYQQALWPGPWIAGALGLLAWWFAARATPTARRAALWLLAAAWAWLGWAFHWQRYADIFLGAPVLAMACWLQAVLLAGAALLPLHRRRPVPVSGHLLAGAALLYPVTGLQFGRPPESFGWMPDPTALGTLGLLLLVGEHPTWRLLLLAALPALHFLWGLGTRWAMAG